MKDVTPYSYKESYILVRKPIGKGNVERAENLTPLERCIMELVGRYGILTRRSLEAAAREQMRTDKANTLARILHSLCERGMLFCYEKQSLDKEKILHPLTFYCLQHNRQTKQFVGEDSMIWVGEEDTYTDEKTIREMLRTLSLNQWHLFLLRDYPDCIEEESLKNHTSSILIKKSGPLRAIRLTCFCCSVKEMENGQAEEIWQYIRQMQKKKRFHLFREPEYILLLCEATGSEMKPLCRAVKNSPLAEYPVLYTTELHVNKGNILDWLFLCTLNEKGEVRRQLISIW